MKNSILITLVAILCTLFETGCLDNITVVRPLDPVSGGISLPASSVALSLSISKLPTYDKFDSKFASEFFQDKFTKELIKELTGHGFTIRQSSDGVDFSMAVVLTDMIVQPLVYEKYGQVLHTAPAVYFVTWDISYMGNGGISFGAIRKKIGTGQVSFMTNVEFMDGTQDAVRVYCPSGLNDSDISQAAREIADFTRKCLILN